MWSAEPPGAFLYSVPAVLRSYAPPPKPLQQKTGSKIRPAITTRPQVPKIAIFRTPPDLTNFFCSIESSKNWNKQPHGEDDYYASCGQVVLSPLDPRRCKQRQFLLDAPVEAPLEKLWSTWRLTEDFFRLRLKRGNFGLVESSRETLSTSQCHLASRYLPYSSNIRKLEVRSSPWRSESKPCHFVHGNHRSGT